MSCHICGYHIFILGNIVVTRHSESWDITGSGLFCHDKKPKLRHTPTPFWLREKRN